MALLESAMEDLLIEQLTQDVSQWTYRPELNTEAKLWDNLRGKLNRNNIDKLQGVLLTDTEMAQVKQFLLDQATSTYKAARWLSGEHQVAQIPLLREDASLGQVSLMAINSREIAGGHSSYEVIHQYRADDVQPESTRRRRFDVTLLINGLPLIHIELKNANHPFKEAFNQIKKYGQEGKFLGLMGLVQMFVVSNGTNTRYIAADNRGNLNEKFLTRWVNEHNEPVEDYLAFAKAVLNIPAAHLMVGKYCVLDNECKKVILLRPYQIHAIEAIRKASYARESGFVWHTTGSGKTLTSYTVTKNLLDIPSLDKAIFLIDRKDLDQQTTSSFLSYADSDDVDIRNTDNTQDLEKKLRSKDRCAIVTTIQKLQHIMRRCSASSPNAHDQKLKEQIALKNIAFVVDECHRTVTAKTKREIETFFARSLWYGFTGTPIFEENKKARVGDLPRTTAAMYGKPKDSNKKCLHAYTIKEAIKDGAVLGFNIQGMGFRRDTLEALALQLDIGSLEVIEQMSDAALEQSVVAAYNKKTGKNFYDDDQHRQYVVDYIINHCEAKFRLNATAGQTYAALLTVPSIEQAQLYYKLFKTFISEGKVSEHIRQLLPDFPKIAITYTVGENEDGARANQEEMQQSLADYNAMFGTSWDLATLNAYNADLNERLARKKSKYLNRDEQLDLVIVVDRLLTGFDAPCLATIFLDRPPMQPHHLIQAFSRTNRIFDKSKRFGNVITLQTPALYGEKIDEALRLYSNGGKDEVQAPSWQQTRDRLVKAIDTFKKVTATPQQADEVLANGSLDQLLKFARAYQAVDRSMSEVQVYDEFASHMFGTVFGMTVEQFEQFTGRYHNIMARIKELKESTPTEPISLDIDYELESIRQIEVNYRYLVALLQSHMPEADDVPKPLSESDDRRMIRLIADYKKSNPKVSEVLEQIWFEIKLNPENFRNRDAFEVIDERINERIKSEIDAFSKKWGFNPHGLRAYALNTPSTEISSQTINTKMADYQAYKEFGGTLAKMKYLRELRQAVADFVKDDIKPLMNR